MPFIRRDNISVEIRGKYEAKHRQELRQALLSPMLTAEQRKDIQRKISELGNSKTYDPTTPPKPGAITVGEK